MDNLPPRILFEDESLLILDKPAGWIVNRADTTRHVVTVQDWVNERLGSDFFEKYKDTGTEFTARSGIVHRIDKDTSGILIATKIEAAFTNIQAQFKKSEVKKTYVALTHGKLVPATGTVNVPIGRLPWNRMRFGVLPAGRESLTDYKVIEYKQFNDGKYTEVLSYVEAYPKTGRTHQIRVHFLHLGHPLFGDALYAGRKTIQRDKRFISRHFLHAARIEFTHPVTHEKIKFESPLPEALSIFLSSLDPVTL